MTSLVEHFYLRDFFMSLTTAITTLGKSQQQYQNQQHWRQEYQPEVGGDGEVRGEVVDGVQHGLVLDLLHPARHKPHNAGLELVAVLVKDLPAPRGKLNIYKTFNRGGSSSF